MLKNYRYRTPDKIKTEGLIKRPLLVRKSSKLLLSNPMDKLKGPSKIVQTHHVKPTTVRKETIAMQTITLNKTRSELSVQIKQ